MSTMMAVEIEGETLAWTEVQKPTPGAGQIRIRVASAGLNRADILQRRGMYPPPEGAVDRMGLEVSGWVDALGDGVTAFREGEEVCALLPSGGYAEYAIAHAGSVMPVPEGIALQDAASLPETIMTVWANVFDIAALEPGETLLVQGGASGIGVTAIQLAKAHGAKVYVTAGSDAKCQECISLGADGAFNYRTQDFEAEMKRVGGANVVLDIVAGEYVSKHVNLLKPHGRLVHIAIQGGMKAEVNILKVMTKRLMVTGSTLRARSDVEKGQIAKTVVEKVWPQIEAGQIRPVIDSRFEMKDAEAAHTRLTSGDHVGKVLLTL